MTDALLSPAVALTMDAISIAAVGVTVVKVRKDEFSEKKIPIMGVAGAMVFAAQMINFSIPATGSSGHIGGGILLAGLLGGVPAFISITAVLIIQCLFFADGGLLALGCNIFNMGVIPCLLVYPLVFKPLIKKSVGFKRLSIASVLSAVVGLEIGAFCVVLQTLLSGIALLPFAAFSALMLPIHLVIGLIEGAVTAAILCFIYEMRPEIIETALSGDRLSGVPIKRSIIILAALAVLAGGALTFIASSKPDGLEWAVGKTVEQAYGADTELTAEGVVFDVAASIQENTAIIPGYTLTHDPDDAADMSAAGIIGAVITFTLAGAAGLVISVAKKRKRAAADV